MSRRKKQPAIEVEKISHWDYATQEGHAEIAREQLSFAASYAEQQEKLLRRWQEAN